MSDINILLTHKIWTIPNFLSNNECQTYIDNIHNKHKHISFTNIENDKYVNNTLTQSFYKTLESYNIPVIHPLIRANNLIMTGIYKIGDNVNIYTNSGLFRSNLHGIESRYMLLIYLNDDYNGGEIQFYTDTFKPIVTIKPKKGMALLFDIDLWLQDNPIINGYKYWIGCEIIAKFFTF